jgi:hypothetical protein
MDETELGHIRIRLILLLFLTLIHYVHIKEFKLQVELLKVRFATGLRKDC